MLVLGVGIISCRYCAYNSGSVKWWRGWRWETYDIMVSSNDTRGYGEVVRLLTFRGGLPFGKHKSDPDGFPKWIPQTARQ